MNNTPKLKSQRELPPGFLQNLDTAIEASRFSLKRIELPFNGTGDAQIELLLNGNEIPYCLYYRCDKQEFQIRREFGGATEILGASQNISSTLDTMNVFLLAEQIHKKLSVIGTNPEVLGKLHPQAILGLKLLIDHLPDGVV